MHDFHHMGSLYHPAPIPREAGRAAFVRNFGGPRPVAGWEENGTRMRYTECEAMIAHAPSRKLFFTAIFTVLALALFLRFFALPSYPPGLYPDEAMNGSNALEAIHGGEWKVFYPENNGREGLFINIQALFLKFFLNFSEYPEPWMLRVPSALFGAFTVFGVFFLARELSRKNGKSEKDAFSIGILSAFFVATSFWHINFSRIGFRAIMAPFFLTWGAYLLILSADKIKKSQITNHKSQTNSNNTNSKRRNFWNLGFGICGLPILAGLVYGLGLHSYIAYRATPLLMVLVFWWIATRIGWKSAGKAFLLFGLGAALSALPLAFYFAENPADFFGRTTQLSVFSSESPIRDLGINIGKTAQMFFFVGDGNARHNLPGAPQLFPPIAFLFLYGTVHGVALMCSRHKVDFMFTFLFAWLIVASLPVVISNEGLPHALRAILMIPAVYIIAGAGALQIGKLVTRRAHWKVARAFFAFFFLLVIFNAYYSYFILWGEERNTTNAFSRDSVIVAKTMNAMPEGVPKYVLVEGGGVDVRGVPMPAQTVMFLTDSFTENERREKNIHYVLPGNEWQIPEGSAKFTIR